MGRDPPMGPATQSRRLWTRTTRLGGSLPDGVTRCSLQMRQVVLPIDSDRGSTVRAGYFKRNDPRRAAFLEERGDGFEYKRFEPRRGVREMAPGVERAMQIDSPVQKAVGAMHCCVGALHLETSV